MKRLLLIFLLLINTSARAYSDKTWVDMATSANGDYVSALDTDSFEQYGDDSWAVWVRLSYKSERRDSFLSPSYKTDLRRYVVRCKDREVATIQRTLQDRDGAPVRQEQWPESKWEFRKIGPRGGTNFTEHQAICSLALLPLRRLDFSQVGQWSQIAPSISVDTASLRTAMPFFFYRMLITENETVRRNDKRVLKTISYFVGNCQEGTSANYALGSLGGGDEVIASHLIAIENLKMERFLDSSPNARLFSTVCRQPVAATGASEVESPKVTGVSSGTGFFVTFDGHAITNAHVVNECKKLTAKGPDGATDPALIVAIDKANDLALLRIMKRPESVLSFRDTPVQVGEQIFVFGYPLHNILADGGSFATGVVSANAGIQNDTTQLQITAPIQPGNSGGALLDQSSRVVGVIVAKINALSVAKITGDIPQNVNFAIKQSAVLSFLNAHDVKPVINSAPRILSQIEVASRAKLATVFLECQR